MIPTATALMALTNGDRKLALKVRRVLDGRLDPRLASKACDAWVRQCYNEPSRIEQIMCAANDLLGMHGCEAIFSDSDNQWPVLEYCNAGDTYTTTLVYDYTKSRFMVASYGDCVERPEREGYVIP